MPQIDFVTYFQQFIWTITCLLLLYICVILKILFSIQKQLALRVVAEVREKNRIFVVAGQTLKSLG